MAKVRITDNARIAKTFKDLFAERVAKYNHNHGPDGRFTSGPSMSPDGKGGGSGSGAKTGIGTGKSSAGEDRKPRYTGHNLDGSLYKGKPGRNYGTADLGDVIGEIRNEPDKDFTLKKHLTPDGKLTPEREALHKQIIDDYFEGKMPTEGEHILRFMGGGSASGKSSVENKGVIPKLDEKSSITVDPDDVKSYLPEFQDFAPTNDKMAGLSHEESSLISKQIYAIALEEGFDVKYDGTGDGSVGSVMKKVNAAKEAGYRVEAEYLTVDVPVALERNQARYESGMKKFKEGRSDIPPRKVGEAEVRSIHKKVSQIAPQVAKNFDRINIYDNNGDGPPVKIAEGGNGKDLKPIKGREREFQKFLDKGNA